MTHKSSLNLLFFISTTALNYHLLLPTPQSWFPAAMALFISYNEQSALILQDFINAVWKNLLYLFTYFTPTFLSCFSGAITFSRILCMFFNLSSLLPAFTMSCFSVILLNLFVRIFDYVPIILRISKRVNTIPPLPPFKYILYLLCCSPVYPYILNT